jgi:hypothetical protein
MAAKFVNLCPHALRLRVNVANTAAVHDDTDVVVQPRLGADGKSDAARVSTTPGGLIGDFGGIAAFGRTTYGAVEGLPDPEENTIYLVSALVGGRPEVASRDDVFIPGTGPKDGAVRDERGQIYAVTRLVQA